MNNAHRQGTDLIERDDRYRDIGAVRKPSAAQRALNRGLVQSTHQRQEVVPSLPGKLGKRLAMMVEINRTADKGTSKVIKPADDMVRKEVLQSFPDAYNNLSPQEILNLWERKRALRSSLDIDRDLTDDDRYIFQKELAELTVNYPGLDDMYKAWRNDSTDLEQMETEDKNNKKNRKKNKKTRDLMRGKGPEDEADESD